MIKYNLSCPYKVDYFNYYRSETPFDLNNMPEPIVSNIINLEFIDNNAEFDKKYYIIFGSVKNGIEKLSNIFLVDTNLLSVNFKKLFSLSPSKGVAYNFQDLGTLWQDINGTIPVTSVDQLIARVDDISGNVNHIIQADISKRPQLKRDNIGYYLWFDGTKTMYSNNIVDFDGISDFTVLSRISKENLNTGILLESSENYNNYMGGFLISQEGNNITISTTGPSYNLGTAEFDTDSTIIGIVNIMITPKVKIRVNGENKNIISSMNNTNKTLSNYRIYIGSRGDSSNFMTTKVRSLAMIGRSLTNEEIINIENILMH